MTIKEVAIHIDQSLSINSRIDAGCRFAMRHSASVRGIYNLPTQNFTAYMDKVSDKSAQFNSSFMREQLELAETVKEHFFTRTAQHELVPDWTQGMGFFTDMLVEEFRYADVAVVGQADEIEISEPSNRFINNLLIQSGVPLLSIPRSGWDREIGRKPIIAWNRERESVRALNSSLSLLNKAECVLVVTAGEDESENLAQAQRCCARLSKHNINARPYSLRCAEFDQAVKILKFAADNDADMLIMGAWGHSRLREALMGGVTQTILRSTMLPLWLMH